MDILCYIKDNIVFLDGGLGTLLQSEGLAGGEPPEIWNITNPDAVIAAHRAYFDAGSNIVCTNTFGVNPLKYEKDKLKELIRAAVANAVKARDTSVGKQEKFIALDIGSLGKLLKPYGELDFEDAVSAYAEIVRVGVLCGVDLIFIETMNDSYDTKAALLAAKENSSLPVFVSNAYGEDGKLLTGATPAAMVAMLEGMGADAIGANCSLGPSQLRGVVTEYLKYASVPVILKPNAGLPSVCCGKTVFNVLPDEFSDIMAEYVGMGIRLAGGCCGTTPEYIRKTVEKSSDITPVPITDKNITQISSYSNAVQFGNYPIIIGERLNPTGKKRLREAVISGDIDYILSCGLSQAERGAHVLDVNVGVPGIDEAKTLCSVVSELQSVTNLPLQIDTSDPAAMERALRRYNGKAMINSVNGKKESMESIFPLAKKYGGLIVCLTLDEGGIPDTAEGRVDIARKITATAAEYGIPKKDLIFDTLTMAVSADSSSALTTLNAAKDVKNTLGCHTSLGVSNVSFGLPCRDAITSVFFAEALRDGLSAAIVNPLSDEIMKAYYSHMAISGLDSGCARYIEKIGSLVSPVQSAPVQQVGNDSVTVGLTPLQNAIVKGLKVQAASLTLSLIQTRDALDIINSEIIPALDIVGTGFEKKTFFLPQLLMSAEAAKAAFAQIKAHTESSEAPASKGIFVLATVRGDIHDIGKNIVGMLLENYGFDVHDLGKDVPLEAVADEVRLTHAPYVGLSALMTTTVPSMEATIKLLRKETPWVKIAVGGAVLTEEYAKSIGADFYGKDAMALIRYVTKL